MLIASNTTQHKLTLYNTTLLIYGVWTNKWAFYSSNIFMIPRSLHCLTFHGKEKYLNLCLEQCSSTKLFILEFSSSWRWVSTLSEWKKQDTSNSFSPTSVINEQMASTSGTRQNRTITACVSLWFGLVLFPNFVPFALRNRCRPLGFFNSK